MLYRIFEVNMTYCVPDPDEPHKEKVVVTVDSDFVRIRKTLRKYSRKRPAPAEDIQSVLNGIFRWCSVCEPAGYGITEWKNFTDEISMHASCSRNISISKSASSWTVAVPASKEEFLFWSASRFHTVQNTSDEYVLPPLHQMKKLHECLTGKIPDGIPGHTALNAFLIAHDNDLWKCMHVRGRFDDGGCARDFMRRLKICFKENFPDACISVRKISN